jgi:hypothetical protein
LIELEEWRDKAYHSAKIYKEKTKRWHDKRIKPKDFKAGDQVTRYYFLILGSSSLERENCTANGKGHTQSSTHHHTEQSHSKMMMV